MTITQLPLALAQRHNNQQLFSNHYLNVTLPQRADWKLLAHDASTALAAIAPTVLKESADYARGVGTSLRGQVYDALKHLAQGFLDYPGMVVAYGVAVAE